MTCITLCDIDQRIEVQKTTTSASYSSLTIKVYRGRATATKAVRTCSNDSTTSTREASDGDSVCMIRTWNTSYIVYSNTEEMHTCGAQNRALILHITSCPTGELATILTKPDWKADWHLETTINQLSQQHESSIL